MTPPPASYLFKGTMGEWFRDAKFKTIVTSPRGDIADFAQSENRAEDEANAMAGAAIPDMIEALIRAEDALASCYQVCDYPADGRSTQDFALASVRNALSKALGQVKGTRE